MMAQAGLPPTNGYLCGYPRSLCTHHVDAESCSSNQVPTRLSRLGLVLTLLPSQWGA